MSGDNDIRAAEYVIGLLDEAESMEVENQAATDPEMATAIFGWQYRLAPLADGIPPHAPSPDAWPRLERALGFVDAPKTGQQHLWWGWSSVAGLRGALVGTICTVVVGGAILYPKLYGQKSEVAALISLDGDKADYKVEMTSDGIATVVAVNPNVPNNASLQFWTLDGGIPVSLGLLPRKGQFQIKRKLLPGAKLLISKEPEGGSPDPGPTGPIIYQGKMIKG